MPIGFLDRNVCQAQFHRAPHRDAAYEPLEPHQVPPALDLPPEALRPRHLDTARGILDAAIAALDRSLGGALTRDQRHRREPVRVVHPATDTHRE